MTTQRSQHWRTLSLTWMMMGSPRLFHGNSRNVCRMRKEGRKKSRLHRWGKEGMALVQCIACIASWQLVHKPISHLMSSASVLMLYRIGVKRALERRAGEVVVPNSLRGLPKSSSSKDWQQDLSSHQLQLHRPSLSLISLNHSQLSLCRSTTCLPPTRALAHPSLLRALWHLWSPHR